MINRIVGYALWLVPARLRLQSRRIPLIGALLHTASHRLSPPGERRWVRVETGPAAGIWMNLDLRFEQRFWRGTYEPELFQRLPSLIGIGDVVYDVGAHAGYFTLAAARLVGEAGSVVAFEPDSRNRSALEAHVNRNQLENVRVIPKAVWSASGSVGFAQDDTHYDRSYGHVEVLAETRVEAVALDDLHDERAPDLIKVDVEGGEADVLAGAVRTLSRARPIVILEAHSAEGSEGVRRLLVGAGYDVEDLAPGRWPAHLLAMPSVAR
jgi:FkbM family methyltransferase